MSRRSRCRLQTRNCHRCACACDVLVFKLQLPRFSFHADRRCLPGPNHTTVDPNQLRLPSAVDHRTRINDDYPVLSTRQSRKPMAFRPCTDGSSAHRYTSLHVAGSGSHAAPMTPTARRCSRIRGHSSRDRLQQEAARKCLEEQQTKLTKHVYAFGRLKVRPCRAKMGLSSICIWLLSTGGLP